MKLFLVRHGETDYNRLRRYQGQIDIPLNQTGLSQAERLHDRLHDEKFDKVYASNLQRAFNTANIIVAGNGLNVMPSDNLREISFGELEGMTYNEISGKYANWKPDNFDFTPFGGESIEQLADRLKVFYRELSDGNQENSNVLTVGHSGSLGVLLCILLDLNINEWWQRHLNTASLTIVEDVLTNPQITLLNDTSFLEE